MAIVVARFGGATLEEIAGEYGVSRERIRQLCDRAGLTKEMLEDRPLFTKKGVAPVSEVLGRMAVRDEVRAARKSKSADAHRAGRRKWVTALKALAAELGRVPTLAELAATQGYDKNDAAMATVYFATRTNGPLKTPYSTRTARLYRAAGFEPPGVGGAGHIVKKDWAGERRRIVRVARQLAAMAGGRPQLRDIARLTGYMTSTGREGGGGFGAAQAFRTGGGSSRRQTSFRTAARRLYRAAGILPPYGSKRSLDQRHGAY